MQLINRCLIHERTFKAYRHLLGCNEFLPPQNKYSNNKFLTSNEDCNQFRCYSGSSAPGIEKRRLPPLMSFPEIVWPSAIKTIRNWIFSNVIITPHLDNDFNMRDFVEGAKRAVEVISAALKEGDFVALKELVAPEAYDELHASISKLNVAEREHLQVIRDDIYFTFPYQVGVMFEENEKRWVEITMVFHVLMGLKNMKNQGEDPPITLGLQPEYQEKLYILNYRFLREFTKGVENSSWIVNVVNHFKLADKARQ